MTSGPDSYPDSWRPRGALQPAASPAPAETGEAVVLAVDAFIASLSDDEFAALVARTRG